MCKLKRTVIKEELVALAGDYKRAIILNQLIYWSYRVHDVVQMIEEEAQRLNGTEESLGNPLYGWIYKRSEDLSNETMMGIRPKSMRDHLKYLVSNGWLFERRNPQDKMDRTLQYRVNWVKIQQDLDKLGYPFEGITLPEYHSKDKKEKGNTHFVKPNVLKETFATAVKETTIDEKENTKIQEEIVTKSENENTKTQKVADPRYEKENSRIQKEVAPKYEKENTPCPKTLDIQGFSAVNLYTENINTKILKTETTNTQITTDITNKQVRQDFVVVVQNKIADLFDTEFSKKQAESLCKIAENENEDVEKMIENTYAYHTKVEKCKNIFGSIRYAIENGGWDICEKVTNTAKDLIHTLPKAVQRQMMGEYKKPVTDETNPEYLEAKARIQHKLEQMRESLAVRNKLSVNSF
jgi:hypothetical protein